MTVSRFASLAPALFVTALASAGCASQGKRIDERAITLVRNGELVGTPTRALDAATTRALEAGSEGRVKRDSLAAVAFGSCAPAVCAALGRGELTLGMTEAQVYTATRTTDVAWTLRRSGGVAVLSPRDADAGPRDAVAPVALVQIAGGAVASLTYREPQGLRTVAASADASDANRVRAAALRAEGDALAAAGEFTGALERYDRASVVHRADAELQYKMATALDKLLRPMEAELRYTIFLHQLELEKIDAVGNANARLAEAIAQARQRLVVLDQRRR